MTKEKIISLWREAGFNTIPEGSALTKLERFADLAVAESYKAQEKPGKQSGEVFISMGQALDHSNIDDLVREKLAESGATGRYFTHSERVETGWKIRWEAM